MSEGLGDRQFYFLWEGGLAVLYPPSGFMRHKTTLVSLLDGTGPGREELMTTDNK